MGAIRLLSQVKHLKFPFGTGNCVCMCFEDVRIVTRYLLPLQLIYFCDTWRPSVTILSLSKCVVVCVTTDVDILLDGQYFSSAAECISDAINLLT